MLPPTMINPPANEHTLTLSQRRETLSSTCHFLQLWVMRIFPPVALQSHLDILLTESLP